VTDNKIILGDSHKVVPTLDQRFTCIIADPPYGVDFQSRRAETPEGKRWVKDVAGDKDLNAAIIDFQRVFRSCAAVAKPQAEAYVFTRWDVVGDWIKAVNGLEDTGFTYKMLLVWDKGIPGMGDIDANWGCGHELILYLKRGRRDLPFRRSGIIHVDKVANMRHIHPTEKPVELIERLLEMSTTFGDWVLDPYSGSGSTAVAARKLGRNSIGVEIDDQYVKSSQERLMQGTMTF